MATQYKTYNPNATEVQLQLTGNDTIVVAGNSTVSNLTSTAAEIVTNARISNLSWGIGGAGAHIVISRGNSSVNAISYVLVNNGEMKDGVRQFVANNTLETGDINVTFVGSANGFVSMTVRKNTFA